MEALKAKIPPRLLALPPASLSEATIASFAASLSEQTPLSAEAARWAVLSWTNALGLPVTTGPEAGRGPVPNYPPAEAIMPSLEEVLRQRGYGQQDGGGLQQVQRPKVDPAGSSAASAFAHIVVFALAAIAGLGVYLISFFSVCHYMMSCGAGPGTGFVFGLAGIAAFRIVWSLLTK